MRHALPTIGALVLAGCHIHLDVPIDVARALARTPALVERAASTPRPAQAAIDPERGVFGEPDLLEQARASYLAGDYREALRTAVQLQLASWRIIAATACSSRDEAWILRAWDNVGGRGRSLFKQVCSRHGVTLVYSPRSDRPRVVLTNDVLGLDAEEDDDAD